MRWDDERYVRLYTPRNDGDWDMWPWQARALFPLMLRKADRIGAIKCGKHGVRALAHMVGLPLEVATPGLAALVEDGCVVEPKLGVLFIRNYLAAQEASTSDRARKEAQRERDRDRLAAESEGLIKAVEGDCNGANNGVTKRDERSRNVTDGHETGQKVTSGHKASQPVTSGHSVPSRAVPCLEDLVDPAGPTTPRFDLAALYARYPRKEGKEAGMKKLKTLIKTQADHDAFSQAVDNYAAKVKREATERQFILLWSTFVGGRWQDYTTGSEALASQPTTQALPFERAPAGAAYRAFDADAARSA